MELSQVLKLNALSRWSPNGELLGCVDENTVKLLPIGDPATIQVFAVSGTIEKFSWAPDSKCFCCLVSSAVHIFNIANPTANYKIEDPQLPIVAAEWTTDSCHIVTAADCNIRLSVWRVNEEVGHEESAVLTCRRPKFPLSAGHAFSPSGSFWVVCTRVECIDSLEVFSCPKTSKDNWTVFKVFQVRTTDLQDLLWTPDETSIVLWDSPVHGSKIFVYHISGQLTHQIEEPCGEFSSICRVELHPASRLLAVGLSDGTIRLFSTIHWREESFSPLLHEGKIRLNKLLVVKEELRDPQQDAQEDKLPQRGGHRLSPRTPSHAARYPRQASAVPGDADGPTVLRCVGTAVARSGGSGSDSSSTDGEETSPEENQLRSPAPGGKVAHKAKAAAAETLLEDSEKNTNDAEKAKKTKRKKNRYLVLPRRKADTASGFSPSLNYSACSSSRRLSGKETEKLRMYFPVEKENDFLPEGISLMRISPCGTFLASTNAEQPTVIFLWNLTSGKLESVSIHRSPVKQMQWNPHPAAFSRAACLAICTGDRRIFIWTAPWQSVVELPKIDDLRCRDLQWSSQGEALLLLDKGKGILLYPPFLYAPPSSCT